MTPPVAENLPFGAAATFIFGQEKFSRHFGVRRNRIVQCETSGSCQNTENKERREDTEETGASGQHGDDLIGARHATENEKEREQERDWQQDDQSLWDLGSVKFRTRPKVKCRSKKLEMLSLISKISQIAMNRRCSKRRPAGSFG